MSSTFPALGHHPFDEEKKLEVLKYLSQGWSLADTVRKDATDIKTVLAHDHPAFFIGDNS